MGNTGTGFEIEASSQARRRLSLSTLSDSLQTFLEFCLHCFPQIFPALPALLEQLQSNFNPNHPRSICSGPACDHLILRGRHQL